MRKLLSARLLAASFIFCCVLATPAFGQSPRPGPVFILRVTAPNETALHTMVDSGYDVATVHGLTATIHATAEERRRLLETGWDVVEVDETEDIEKTLGVYHTYATLTSELQAYADQYPDICRIESLGQSYQGRELWAFLITDNPDVEEDEPECKFVATMHGDEPTGMELCLYLIDLLVSHYGTDQRISTLVDGTALWIVPLMNPDGLSLTPARRTNAEGYDLNRRFPYYPDDFTGTIFTSPLDTSGRPPEVVRIMNWSTQNSFTLGANLHAGALVVNYPYDYGQGIPSGQPAPSPDEALFQYVSRAYSIHNTPMWNSPEFDDGIVNGSDWYAITGSLQDWDYRYAGCNHVTLELSDVKRPAAATLAQLWEDNRESMLAYLESAQMGARGIVTDAQTGLPLYAQILVEGNSQPVFTDPDIGDYHRMLLPGTYTLEISAPGYWPRRIGGVVVEGSGAVRVDAALYTEAEPEPLPISPLARLLLMLLLAIFGLGWLFGGSKQVSEGQAADTVSASVLMPALLGLLI